VTVRTTGANLFSSRSVTFGFPVFIVFPLPLAMTKTLLNLLVWTFGLLTTVGDLQWWHRDPLFQSTLVCFSSPIAKPTLPKLRQGPSSEYQRLVLIANRRSLDADQQTAALVSLKLVRFPSRGYVLFHRISFLFTPLLDITRDFGSGALLLRQSLWKFPLLLFFFPMVAAGFK